MADPTNLPPLPANHLDHPENWATGGDSATDKQKGFVKVLEKQHPELVPDEGLHTDSMGKSEASEVIDKLKSGKPIEGHTQEEEVKEGNEEEVKEISKEEVEAANQVEKDVANASSNAKAGDKRKAEVDSTPATTTDEAKAANGSADADDEMSGKVIKETKQTTLDSVIGKTNGSGGDEKKNGEAVDGGDDVEGRKTKKAKVDVKGENTVRQLSVAYLPKLIRQRRKRPILSSAHPALHQQLPTQPKPNLPPPHHPLRQPAKTTPSPVQTPISIILKTGRQAMNLLPRNKRGI